MQKKKLKRALSLVLCLVLIAAMALCATGCGDKASADTVSFTFVVVDKEGNEETFDVETDKKTVGEALLEEELIAGEDSEYGLYVTTVNGETLDWDTDGMYWAFLIDGEYAMTGVDGTDVTDGATYSMVATAG